MAQRFKIVPIVAVLVTGMVAAASGDKSSEPVQGTYHFTGRSGVLTLQLKDKGEFVVRPLSTEGQPLADSQPLVTGSYKATKDELELTDDADSGPCPKDQKTGTYKWQLDGVEMRFTRLEDQCLNRSTGLTAGTWRKVD